MRVAYQPEIVGRTESNVEHVYGLCVRERDNNMGEGRERDYARIRVDWKLRKIDDIREEKRVDKFMDMNVFCKIFRRLRINYHTRV